MKKEGKMKCWYSLAMVALALGAAPVAVAAPSATLTLENSSINFPSRNPATVTSIASSQNPMSINIQTSGTTTWSLTLLANGDLVSGGDTIPISNITWTASGTGFVGGAMSKTTSSTVASGSGDVNRTGSQRFFLSNSWNYATGSYSQTVVYTLVAL
jgi:hypothetical protein